MSNSRQQHWDDIYSTRAADTVSWHQDDPTPSLSMIAATGVGADASVIDVGGGASALVDRLIERGFNRVTVLDIAGSGLAVAKARLGALQSKANWLVEDITRWQPQPGTFNLWHDRAVFHFLVDEVDRAGYRRALDRGLRPDGFVVLAAFALTGPDMCSGLPVRRYSAEMVQAELGPAYDLIDVRPQIHTTPAGRTQQFVWCLFRRLG